MSGRRDDCGSRVARGMFGGSGDAESGPSADLSKEGFDFREDESGNLVVTVTVKNAGDAEGTGHVYVTVTASEPTTGTETSDNATGESETETDDGDDTVAARESREVTVPAGETKTVTLSFDVAYRQFARGGNIEVDFRP
ncbi:hypothetical protein [Halorussus caseinilyticus]|uniref:CARDB domain-containing protein n=1 Tax=Halorussus caseinilyticus TaxID=3034025 RepID=A0ABD5WKD1_9EURY